MDNLSLSNKYVHFQIYACMLMHLYVHGLSCKPTQDKKHEFSISPSDSKNSIYSSCPETANSKVVKNELLFLNVRT